jgi:hypothetical protein
VKRFAGGLLCLGLVSAPLVGEQQTWGTTDVSYIRVPASAFLPFDSAQSYSGTFGQRWGDAAQAVFYSPLLLPSGARIVSLDYDFVDTNDTVRALANLTVCDRYGANPVFHPAAGAGPADCISPGFLCSGDAFDGGNGTVSADLTPDNLTFDPVQNSYFLRADTYAGDGSIRFAGILVGYVLQVSTAPGQPTFGDVPVDHPFFQFIEALAASGITAGCGGGNFCPESPLTRGQMAVFLAKALGLHFP